MSKSKWKYNKNCYFYWPHSFLLGCNSIIFNQILSCSLIHRLKFNTVTFMTKKGNSILIFCSLCYVWSKVYINTGSINLLLSWVKLLVYENFKIFKHSISQRSDTYHIFFLPFHSLCSWYFHTRKIFFSPFRDSIALSGTHCSCTKLQAESNRKLSQSRLCSFSVTIDNVKHSKGQVDTHFPKSRVSGMICYL